MRGVFGGWLGGGRAFLGGWHYEGIVVPAAVPRARVADLAVPLLPKLRFFPGADQREDRARYDGDVRAAHNFKQAQCVNDFFVAPLVAGDNGDPENFDLRRLN